MGTFTHVWQGHQPMCFPVVCVGNWIQNCSYSLNKTERSISIQGSSLLIIYKYTQETRWQTRKKGLVNLSFLQTDETNYFPELTFWFFFILNGSNLVKWGHEAALNAQKSVRTASSSYLIWWKPFRMKKKSKF